MPANFVHRARNPDGAGGGGALGWDEAKGGLWARSRAAALTTMHLRDRAGNELPAPPTDPPLAFRSVSSSSASEIAMALEPHRCGRGAA